MEERKIATLYVTKNKSELPKRRPNNEYISPRWLCEQALAEIHGEPFLILDPGAGKGAWGKAAHQRWPEAFISGIEINPEREMPEGYLTWRHADFMKVDTVPVDLIIGNPPWQRGELEAWIRKCFRHLAFGGQMVLALPLPFLAGQNRSQRFYREFPPERVLICGKRPSWNEDERGTNAEETAVYYWRNGFKGETRLGWLGQEKGGSN